MGVMTIPFVTTAGGYMDDVDRSKLADAIERLTLIDALEQDPGLINNRKIHALLDRTFDAWKIYSDLKSHVKRMLKIKSTLGAAVRRVNKENNVHGFDIKSFDLDYLDWFDGLVQSLEPEQISLIRYEVFDKDNRRRSSDWGQQWGLSARTYYYRLKDVRERLVIAIINKY